MSGMCQKCSNKISDFNDNKEKFFIKAKFWIEAVNFNECAEGFFYVEAGLLIQRISQSARAGGRKSQNVSIS